MAEFKPYMQSPLHHFDLPARASLVNDTAGIWANELPLRGFTTLRGDANDPAFVSAVESTLKQSLPVKPSTFSFGPSGTVIWLSPDEWLITGPKEKNTSLMQSLEAALGEQHVQVVDNSGGYTMVYLTGKEHVTSLRHLGVYDFESIEPGQAISTVISKINVTVYRHDNKGFFVIFRRSFADYVWKIIERTAKPYGFGVCALSSELGLVG
ncbi:sarcosine oxidase subunit gamma [Leeia sp. TBRC 13508]|uniref:Sarcosine oxidase subunit gamma n=1 Tax=Leeia speluncae TaxID=2884804 RepID=A0ABS8DBN6_9NEIS|nr:sarcosine oxidase subunit gamma family protein [Leeia speluncae]MCB6185413.1 sarcosine oxidase subunit gamma [Leeia speluncae]